MIDVRELGPENEGNAVFPHLVLDDLRGVRVFACEDSGTTLEDRDAAAEPREALGQLAAQRTGTDDRQARRKLGQVEDGFVREAAGGVEAGDIWNCRASPGADGGFHEAEVDSPAWIVSGPVNFASPRKTSTPIDLNRWAESLRLRRARSLRIRAMTRPKSQLAASAGMFTPNSPAVLRSAQAREARTSALEGTQPTFRQSPPNRCFSTRATLAPSPAAMAAVTSPAVPAPMTARLYRPAGVGLTQPDGWTLSTRARLNSSSGGIVMLFT